jgi:molybdopterin-synthase adenylyltransferase
MEGIWRMNRYSRQILFSGIGAKGQEKLCNAKVAIVGVGALGTVSANNMARAGVGYLKLIDRDFVEYSNLQRQSLYDEQDAAKTLPKAVAAAEKLGKINSEIHCAAVIEDLNPGNVLAHLEGMDLVIDGTDNFETRFVINDACWKLGIPWVYGGSVGATGMVATFVPNKTGCLRCLFDSPPAPGMSPTCDTAGIINPASGMVACIQSAEALKLLVGAESKVSSSLVSFNLWESNYENFDLTGSKLPNCPCCSKGEYEFLKREGGLQSAYLCGRDAVQVIPAQNSLQLDLHSLAKRLETLGQVQVNSFLLRFSIDAYEIVLFKEGRAIIKGTNNEGVAKGLYARYFGL